MSDEVARIEHALQQRLYKQMDKTLGALLVVQYVAAIVVALVVSPRTWSGDMSETHVHVIAALGLGAVLTVFPVYLAKFRSGEFVTRCTIGVAQLGYSALFIHLSGGRIETHFHIFASLAFLAFYRDYRVILAATAVVVVDHLVRSFLWPESLFGVMSSGFGRVLEHAGWVVLEDIVLLRGAIEGQREMRRSAEVQASARLAEERAEEKAKDALLARQRAEEAQAESARREAELGTLVERLHTTLSHVAERDLSSRMGAFQTQVGQDIAAIVNRALDGIGSGFGSVLKASERVASGADGIVRQSQELTDAASAQAEAVEEVSSTLATITEQVRRVDTETEQASRLALSARESALNGRSEAKELGRVIEQMRQSANETAKVVAAVDEIAFQTNLLALNAAVEAARAGNAGRGFAVVADEVRSLASRSAKAAAETSERIEQVVTAASLGVTATTDVLSRFADIEQSVAAVQSVIETASELTGEQRTGLEQVSEAARQIANQTQSTAASCDESLRQATLLRTSGVELRSTVERFNLPEGGSGRSVRLAS